jgi:hypothetical protein
MMKRISLVTVLLGGWFTFVLLACNLSSPTGPPTLVPRATATPPPTIGFATISPEELPVEATAAPPTTNNAELINMINQVSSERLMTHVQSLQNFGTRHVNSTYSDPNYGIGAARTYITNVFKEIEAQSDGRFRVIPHNFPVEFNGVRSTAENIVGYLAGRETGAGVILLGAHYDSISYDQGDGVSYSPGANDNGSGVGALLELARVMAAQPEAPRATILFAAFSAEEINRVGSKAFVRDYIQQYNLELTAMINMDIIGSSTGPDGEVRDRELRIYSEGPNESAARQLARSMNLLVNNYMGDSFRWVLQDAIDREGRYSDHFSFSEAGYPAVRVIEPLEDTFRQHTTSDTIEDVQSAYFTRATQSIAISTWALANGPRPPRNITVRDNGTPVRSLVWEPMPDAISYIVALRYPGSLQYDNYFQTSDTNIASEIFTASRIAAIAIAGRDSNGLLGPMSREYIITN